MKLPDLIETEIMTVARTDKGTAVIVRPLETDKAVPIFIGQLEAHSILIGIGKVPMPRPLTHDLLIGVLNRAKMVLERVEITDLREGTFYAHLVFRHGVKHFDIDSRPSDALALVARLDVPLFVSRHVVEEAGIPIDMISEESPEVEIDLAPADDSQVQEEPAAPLVEPVPGDERQFRKVSLQQLLDKAIEAEDYEEAARLRDELSRL